MSSMREIKQRIRSVSNTRHITKAMHLVAVSKLQRARTKLNMTRPYFEETKRMLTSIVTNSGSSNVFLKERPVKAIAVILLTGDKGLCGGYNVNVSKEAMKLVRSKKTEQANEHVIVVGTKGRDYFRRRRKNIIRVYTGISEAPLYDDAAEIGRMVSDMFVDGEVDEVYLAYTTFKSTISQEPVIVRLLPFETNGVNGESAPVHTGAMEYEPGENAILDYAVPKYINTYIYGAMVESAACEQGARMTCMDSASENADEMINNLTVKYNRARQGAITQEITEIVSGADAL